MVDSQVVRKLVERALAFAHAAVDEPSPNHIAEAKKYVAMVLPLMAYPASKGVPLGDARLLVELVGQLRAVLQVVERKSEMEAESGRN